MPHGIGGNPGILIITCTGGAGGGTGCRGTGRGPRSGTPGTVAALISDDGGTTPRDPGATNSGETRTCAGDPPLRYAADQLNTFPAYANEWLYRNTARNS
ncbi:hypothetical protein [Nocardia gipuzkoensis]|uniref:hypothetical protein n=1 Tax=Nocardia gipuzkoensis TaxID=2749991 RepID=UPI003EE14872